jgi:acetoacetyl-CoA synthetase
MFFHPARSLRRHVTRKVRHRPKSTRRTHVVDDALHARIAAELRGALSPRHVPDTLEAVPAIPRTLTAKKLELPVKRILLGVPAAEVASRDALADRSPGRCIPQRPRRRQSFVLRPGRQRCLRL